MPGQWEERDMGAGSPRCVGRCPTCGAGPGDGCAGASYGGVHAERLRANNIPAASAPGYLESRRAANLARSKPTVRPDSGPAVVVPAPHRAGAAQALRYRPPLPQMWVFWRDRWKLALVLARHDYPNGTVAYEVEFYDQLEHARIRWPLLGGRDSIRAVESW
jgi:hypothetical protein